VKSVVILSVAKNLNDVGSIVSLRFFPSTSLRTGSPVGCQNDGDIEARRDPRKHESPCDPLDSLLQASDTAIV